MGNNTSGQSVHPILRINGKGTVGEVLHIKGEYPNGTPQTIVVEGNPLDATIEIDNATIVFYGRLHRVTVTGDNNRIYVYDDDVRVRVEGVGNNIWSDRSLLVSTKINTGKAVSDERGVEEEKGEETSNQDESSTPKRGHSGDSPEEPDAKKPKKS